MSIGNTTENDILKLYFNATAIANIADNAASTPETNVSCALHTGDPGDAGTMSTSETTYTGYSRQNVARTTGGWTASSAGSTSPVAEISFGAWSSGAGTITHWSAGKTGGGASNIYFSGAVTPNITLGAGVTPKLSTSSTITMD